MPKNTTPGMTLPTLTAAALAATALVLAAPALASNDDSTGATSPRTSSADGGSTGPLGPRGAPTDPAEVAAELARFQQFKAALRSGAADSTAPLVGQGGSITVLLEATRIPDARADLTDITIQPQSP